MIKDILDEIRGIKSSTRDLRNFGLVVGGVFLSVGAFLLWRGRPSSPYVAGIGAGLFAFGFMWPAALKPLQKAWMALAVVLGWFMTRVILIALFYLVVTPLGLLARISGKRFLGGRTAKTANSCWDYRKPEEFRKEDYQRQF